MFFEVLNLLFHSSLSIMAELIMGSFIFDVIVDSLGIMFLSDRLGEGMLEAFLFLTGIAIINIPADRALMFDTSFWTDFANFASFAGRVLVLA